MLTLATRLDRDRFRPYVSVLKGGGVLQGELELAQIPVTPLGQRWKYDPIAFYRLEKEIRKIQPDIVHTWLFRANTYGRLAAIRSGTKRLIATEPSIDPWKRGVDWAMDRHLAHRSEKVVVHSDAVHQHCLDHKIPLDKLALIPDGIDTTLYQLPSIRQQILDDLHLPSSARLIGMLGPLTSNKRIKDAILAFDLLKTVRDDAHLLIIGEGPIQWQLLQFRDNLALGDRVHFLGDRADVPQLLPSLDLLWTLSENEGIPYSIMEAMAAALPVVASDIPSNRTLVLPEKTGYLVPRGDCGSLARWTQPLLDQPDLALRFGEAARHRMETEFPIEKMLSAYEKLYETG